MAFGCSSFSWRTEDNRHLLGRTYDQFGDLTANRVISVPQGFAVPGKDELDGVSRMFRAFAPVDIPEGLAKADPNYGVYEQTLCTSVMCAESGVYYFAPAQNRRISAVQLLAQGTEMQYFDLGNGQDIDWRN